MVHKNKVHIEFEKLEQTMTRNVEQTLIFNPKLSTWLWIIPKYFFLLKRGNVPYSLGTIGTSLFPVLPKM